MYKSRIALLGLLIVSLASCQSTTDSSSYSQTSGNGSIKITQLEDNRTQIGEIISFGVDESGINSEMMSVLDSQVAYLKENGRQNITIEGHTDEQGTREYNLGLGAKRSNSVKAYMVSQGLSTSRIDVVTYGKERPVSLCSEEKCWKENRRAVTVIAGGFN